MLILLTVSLLSLMPITCRRILSMDMVVIQPYILVSKLNLRQGSYIILVTQTPYKPYIARFIANSRSCTTRELPNLSASCYRYQKLLLSTEKKYIKGWVRIHFGLKKSGDVLYKLKTRDLFKPHCVVPLSMAHQS